MKDRIEELLKSLTFRMVCGVMVLLFAVNILTSAVGYLTFTKFFKEEYTESAVYNAQSARYLLDGDKIEGYISSKGSGEEYGRISELLSMLCSAQHLNLIDVVTLNETQDKLCVVLDILNPDGPYGGGEPWEPGTYIDISDDRFRNNYIDIWTGEAQLSTEICGDALHGHEAYVAGFMPVKDSAGKVSAIICVQRPMEELIAGRIKYVRIMGFSLLALAVLMGISLTFYLKTQFVTPTKNIIKEAQRFSRESCKGDFTELSRMDNVRGITEIHDLVESLERMETDTVQFMDNLKTVTATQERLSTELSLATHIQANVLPNLFPPFPDRKEFEIYATMAPAKEVGGDFYDFFLLDEDHLGIVMADVSGKGVPAALLMMATKIQIKTYALMGGSPAAVLEAVNNENCTVNVDDMFVTVWLGILTVSTGEIIAANAGHEYPIVRHGNGDFELMRDKHGFVVGGLYGTKYKDYTFRLDPEDTLFLYTDGVTEAAGADNIMFGTDNLLKALNRNPKASVHEAVSSVSETIQTFVGRSEQFDDITMLCLKMTSEQNEKSIVVSPGAETVGTVSEFLEDAVEEWELPVKLTRTLQIVLDEVFSNIVNYSQATTTMLKLRRIENGVEMVFADNGIPYDPTGAPDPDITLSAEERDVGGLGIFMVRKIMDDVVYRYESGKNILVLKKFYSADKG